MPDAMCVLNPVFVYGTLRRGGSNDINHHAPAPRAMGDGTIAGTLYNLGAYPGVRLGGTDRVRGEVYGVAPEVEAMLDRLEDVRSDEMGEYRRRHAQVSLDDGRNLDCLVYEIHPERVRLAPLIASGDWFGRA